MWNRPTGDSFRSTWGGETSVTVQLQDGTIITRAKDTNKNEYVVNNRVLSAIKTDVPDEVKQALQINEINLQSQFDAPFLISDTPGEVATHFNKIAHLDQIDVGTKKINSWIVDLEQEVKKGEKEIDDKKGQLIQYEDLDKLEAQIEVLEGLEKNKNRVVNTQKELVQLVNKIKETQEKINTLLSVLLLEKTVDRVLALLQAKTEKENEQQQLLQLTEEIAENKRKTANFKALIQAEPTVKKVSELYNVLQEKEKENIIIKGLIKSIREKEKVTTNLQEHIAKLEKRFVKEMGDTCILCGSTLTGKNNI